MRLRQPAGWRGWQEERSNSLEGRKPVVQRHRNACSPATDLARRMAESWTARRYKAANLQCHATFAGSKDCLYCDLEVLDSSTVQMHRSADEYTGLAIAREGYGRSRLVHHAANSKDYLCSSETVRPQGCQVSLYSSESHCKWPNLTVNGQISLSHCCTRKSHCQKLIHAFIKISEFQSDWTVSLTCCFLSVATAFIKHHPRNSMAPPVVVGDYCYGTSLPCLTATEIST